MAIEWLLIYAALGTAVGFLAGLLGVGGGTVLVPMLVILFQLQNFPDETLMQVILATSMATILFTSLASVRAHQLQGAIRWPVVMAIVPGVLLGSLLGSKLVSLLSSQFLTLLVTCFLFYIATQMLWGFKPKLSSGLPGRRGLFWVGSILGCLSAMVGAGGGFFSVPFLSWRNVPMHQAIATSAALGFPIAVFTTLGNVWNGWNAAPVPEHTYGYIYLPALVSISLASVLMAPIGAKLAHQLPVSVLKKIFAVTLYLLALRLFWSVTR